MIIEPVPTSPLSPLSRLRRLLGIVMVPVLLVGVVGLGLAGRDRTERGPGDSPPPAALNPAAPTGGIDGLVPQDPPAVAAADFPERILGSDVLTPSEARTAQRADAGAFLFVAGWLTMGALDPTCGDRLYRPSGGLCHRTSVLTELPAAPSADGMGWTAVGPHLHPEFPPGVRVPPGVGRFEPEPRGEPVPVVVLGRYGDPRAAPCDPSTGRCRPPFVVERIVWTNGERFGWTTTIDAGLELDLAEEPWRRYRDAARTHLEEVTLISMSALVEPTSLARVDRRAAAALEDYLASANERVPFVWYVRGVDLRERRGGGLRGTARWVITGGDGSELLVSSEDAQAR
jgi:hypothetical protein